MIQWFHGVERDNESFTKLGNLHFPEKKEQSSPKINDPNLNLHKYLLVVLTHLKNTSQNGNLPQVGVKIKNI